MPWRTLDVSYQLLILSSLTCGALVLVYQSISPRMHSAPVAVHRRHTANHTALVLFWTKFAGSLNRGQLSDLFQSCSYNNCLVTRNRSLTNHAAAILFDMSEFSLADLPNQAHRKGSQRYVFAHFESVGNPQNLPARHQLKALDAATGGFFNLTMSYRLDSDIFADAYIRTFIAASHRRRVRAKDKHRDTLWTVSHCSTSSKREDYAAELFRYINVTKIGKCSGKGTKDLCANGPCGDEVYGSFKFHLAFENSVCKDYITEKAFKPLNYGSIPVVLGGADYRKFMPPNSYINVEDFATSKDLAEYLKYLAANDAEYERYFDWTRTTPSFVIAGNNGVPGADRSWWCELCRILHGPVETNVYEDVYEWWFQPGQCRKLRFKNTIV